MGGNIDGFDLTLRKKMPVFLIHSKKSVHLLARVGIFLYLCVRFAKNAFVDAKGGKLNEKRN